MYDALPRQRPHPLLRWLAHLALVLILCFVANFVLLATFDSTAVDSLPPSYWIVVIALSLISVLLYVAQEGPVDPQHVARRALWIALFGLVVVAGTFWSAHDLGWDGRSVLVALGGVYVLADGLWRLGHSQTRS